MALFCTKCGAKLNENVKFCEKCGAPVEGAPAKKKIILETGSGSAPKKNGLIGVAVIAVAVLVVISFVIKGFGGAKNETGGEGGLGSPSDGVTEDEDDVLAHLRPWMGEWRNTYAIDGDAVASAVNDTENEGTYAGGVLSWNISNPKVCIHVNEQYIDFSDLTKDQKDRFPVSSLTYSKTDFGADAFEDEDREIRILFYDNYSPNNYKDYGTVMKIQIYVGEGVSIIDYIVENVPIANIIAASDGWATDRRSFVRVD